MILATESHLDHSITNSEVFPPNFSAYRKDSNRHRGGVFILVKNNISSSVIDIDTSIEIIWVKLHTNNKKDLIFGSFYCPPNSPASVLDELYTSICLIKSKFPASIIYLGGDFNCPGIDWAHGCLTDSYISASFRERLVTISNNLFLDQVITVPTRGPNILDLCFTSHSNTIQNFYTIPGLSDHLTVVVDIAPCSYHTKQLTRKVYLYKKADWEAVREHLHSISETYFLLNSTPARSVDENWQLIQQECLKRIDSHVPYKKSSNHFHLPWMSVSLKRQIKKKQRVYNRAKLFQRDSDWREYKNLQREVKQSLRNAHHQYIANIINPLDSSVNKKPFWHYIKSRRQDRSGVGTLKSSDGRPITTPSEKAHLLNHQFKSVFTIDSNEPHIINRNNTETDQTIQDIEISISGVYNLLSKSDIHKSQGPDNIHPHFLKETASELAPMLTHLFQQSLDSGVLPNDWKKAYVTPIYEKGDKTNPANYRPISLTSVVCKVMEHILASHIMQYLDTNNILLDTQFGFRSKHSCETQLLLTTTDLAKAIDKNLQTDVGILDFSKAFDKVSHNRLLHKLKHYGINGNILHWIKSFLHGRTQQVVVEGSYSSPCPVTSGVPQGSVLGPILFLIYINDISNNIHSQLRLFADDCLVYRTIQSSGDHLILQDDFNTLTSWAKANNMEFNITKCKIIQVTTLHNKSSFTYTMNGTPLQPVDHHLYLGVYIHHKLSWQPQVDYICNKANRILGFLWRNLRGSPKTL